MPSSFAARTVRRRPCTPRRWPSARGSPRAAAQRPLPAMMRAACRATAIASICAVRSSSLLDIPLQPSNREDFPLFCCEHPIHFGDRLVGSFLHLLGRPFAVVLAYLVVLFQFLEHGQANTPHVSRGH